MLIVDLRLRMHDLAAQMADMRIWLDHHSIEASAFSLTNSIACLAFREELQAEAFALQFGGRVRPISDEPGNREPRESIPIAVDRGDRTARASHVLEDRAADLAA